MRVRDVLIRAKIDHEALYARALFGFVILGIVLRLVRYLQNFPLWCDETMLAVNLLDRHWTELARPLDYHQVCPLGFLALEWLVVRCAGFSEWTLRLIPLLSALGSVPVFLLLARRVLGQRSHATLLATALFAVSAPPIRYAAEVKPYATDILASAALLGAAVAWHQSRSRSHWLHALTLIAVLPLAVSISLPSLFVIAAIVLLGLYEILLRRRLGLIIAYGGLVATAGLAVAVVAALGQYHTAAADKPYFLEFWASAFPPNWRDPAALATWLLRAHTGPLFAYPHGAGGPAFLTALVFGAFVAGAVVCWRRDPRVTALLVLPFLLTLAAASLRRYPYGMSARVAQFLVPSTLLLVAAGTAWLAAWFRAQWPAPRVVPVLAIALAGWGLWRVGHDLAHPYRTPWDAAARTFARRFWREMAKDAVLVCAETDLGISCHEGRWAYDGTDQYLCLQRIYSDRHRQGLPPRWEAISASRPLRCVLINRTPDEVPAFRAWVEANREKYSLRDIRTYSGPRGSPVEPAVDYFVCEFVPATTASAVSMGTKRENIRQGIMR
jgi:hypothetical protein